MRATVALVLLAATLSGCTARGTANLEIESARSDSKVLCGDDGVAFASVSYQLWNSGPDTALDMVPSYVVMAGHYNYTNVRETLPTQTSESRDYDTIPSLPVDARHAYQVFVSLHGDCSNATGVQEDWTVRLYVKPSNGPVATHLVTIECVWRPYHFVAGQTCE